MTLSEIKNFFSTTASEASNKIQPFLVEKVVSDAKNAFGVKPTAITNTETSDEAFDEHVQPLASGTMSKGTKVLIGAALGIGGAIFIYKKFIKKAA